MEVLARRAGSDRTPVGALADELGERVGSPAAVRRQAIAAVSALPPDTLPWAPRLVLGIGHR